MYYIGAVAFGATPRENEQLGRKLVNKNEVFEMTNVSTQKCLGMPLLVPGPLLPRHVFSFQPVLGPRCRKLGAGGKKLFHLISTQIKGSMPTILF